MIHFVAWCLLSSFSTIFFMPAEKRYIPAAMPAISMMMVMMGMGRVYEKPGSLAKKNISALLIDSW